VADAPGLSRWLAPTAAGRKYPRRPYAAMRPPSRSGAGNGPWRRRTGPGRSYQVTASNAPILPAAR
jgi:hypothetical protein